jgi:hypothetical protein
MTNKSLMSALMAMHAEFGVILEKDKKGNRGTYTSLPGVLSQIHHMTKKHGLVLLQAPIFRDGMQLLYTKLFHPESSMDIECVSILTPTPNAPSADQAYGSSMTYHRRYDAMALCGLFCDEDPSDHDGWDDHKRSSPQHEGLRKDHEVPQQAPGSSMINEKQVGLLAYKLKGKDELRSQLIGAYGSLEKIPSNKMNAVLERIESDGK